MANPIKPMTTNEFAKAVGIPPATVSKLIRDGKLKAKKEGKCWMIAPSQLEAKAVRQLGKAATPAKGRKAAAPAAAARADKAAGAAARPAPPVDPLPAATSAEPASKPAAVPALIPPPEEKTYTVAEFAAMTYFTETGVVEWLRAGRLKGRQDAGGKWIVFESSLQAPYISRLVRK